MPTLSHVLSLDDAIASFLANKDYRANDSTSQAQSLISAIDVLLVMRPRQATFGGNAGETVTFDTAALKLVRDEAEKFVKQRRQVSLDPTIGYVNTEYYIQ
jgi:hypothetical protein